MDIQIGTDICMGFVRGSIGSDTVGRMPRRYENKCIYIDIHINIYMNTKKYI